MMISQLSFAFQLYFYGRLRNVKLRNFARQFPSIVVIITMAEDFAAAQVVATYMHHRVK